MAETDMDLSYQSGQMCGDCLHHKHSHDIDRGLQLCAVCHKHCDLELFDVVHRPCDVIVDQTTKTRWERPDPAKRKAPVVPAQVPVAPAPLSVTGQ